MIYLKMFSYVAALICALASLVVLSDFMAPEDSGAYTAGCTRVIVYGDEVRFEVYTPDGEIAWERPLAREK